MPPLGPEPSAGGPAPRAGSPRRDPLALLAVAALLLTLRVVLGVLEARAPAGPPAGMVPDAADVRWRTLEAGLAEARAADRPILYDFTAEWCPPCQAMQRHVFSDPRAAAEIESRFVPVRVLDRQREEGRNASWVDSLQARYRVDSFPTLVVTDPGGGGEARRLVGFMGRDATLGQLRGAGVSLR
jgi:thiol:disulfide interchange protein